ncbi:DUF6541 family protein [Actinomyces wuliandei]|uniref:DUF6541 family protein n=1 Tax=Actinomyces wuliandei TaxID=2057743 RepID=UPI00311AAFAB
MFVPGYLLLRGLRVLRLQALAAAPSVASAGMGALVVLYHLLSLPWNTLTASLGLLVLLVAVLAVTRLARRRWPGAEEDPPPRTWWPLVAALVLACLLSAQAVLRGLGGIDTPMQASDGVWHLNAATYVRSQANAYPVGSLDPMYWGETHYYPTGWHALVAVVPASVPVAANVVALLGACVIWPLGCASLLSAVLPVASRRVRDGLPLLAGTVASSIATGPFSMLTTLWPYAWAVCLLPGAVPLILVCRPQRGPAPRRTTTWLPGTVAGALLAALGLVFVHGTSVFNLAVIGVPALLLVLLHEVRRCWRAGGRLRAGMLVLAGGLVLAVVVGAVLFADQLIMLARFTRPGAMVTTMLIEAWRDSPMLANISDRSFGATVLTLLACVGLLVSLVTRRHRWAALCLPLVLVLLAASVLTWTPLSLLASPWYLQRARILPLLEISTLVLAATTIDWLTGLARSRSGAPRAVAGVLALICSVALVVNAVGRAGMHERVVAVAYQPQHLTWTAMLSPGEADFIREAAGQLPSDAVVLGQPTNGSAYFWSLTQTPVVFPTLRFYSEEDRRYVAARAAYVQVDPEVCQALDRLGAHYYYYDADPTEGDPPGGGKAPQWHNQLNLIPDEALTPVASDGVHTLYVISACGWSS